MAFKKEKKIVKFNKIYYLLVFFLKTIDLE